MKNYPIKSICVFCGAKSGANPVYKEAAAKFGVLLANNNINLVYGGGKVGMMGAIANAVLGAGGNVIGIIPDFLVEKELAHTGVTELHIVDSMHQRKELMAKLSDAFVMLPGGIGTLEEFFEVWSWQDLKLHNKPIGILNTNHYFDGLIKLLNFSGEENFLQIAAVDRLIVAKNPEILLENLYPLIANKFSKKQLCVDPTT